MSSTRERVLIVGAGPTGLVLALCLTQLGIRVRIVDKDREAGTTSRAMGVHARTLEFYRQLGLAQEVGGLRDPDGRGKPLGQRGQGGANSPGGAWGRPDRLSLHPHVSPG